MTCLPCANTALLRNIVNNSAVRAPFRMTSDRFAYFLWAANDDGPEAA